MKISGNEVIHVVGTPLKDYDFLKKFEHALFLFCFLVLVLVFFFWFCFVFGFFCLMRILDDSAVPPSPLKKTPIIPAFKSMQQVKRHWIG